MMQRDPAIDALAGLDALAASTDESRPQPRWAVPAGPLLRMAAGLALRPVRAARHGIGLAGELVQVALGHPADGTGVLGAARRATRSAADRLIDDAGLDGADRNRLRAGLAALDVLADAVLPAAPTRHPDAGARPRPIPRFLVGEEIATTPGAVVLRTPVFELIQYLPRTETVRAVPLLVVGPLANRHYLADLAPRRSLVAHLVAAGQQVFALSWHNPGPQDADRDLDAYAAAVLVALDACERISRTPSTALLAFGSAGVVATGLLGHLAATGTAQRVTTLTLAGAVLGRPGPPHPTGPLAGPPLAELRFWAADTLRVTSALHADLSDIAARDALAHPGAVRVLGTPVDLAKVDHDTYLVAGDHGSWQLGYRAARLLGGECRFVLVPGGPVEALAKPAGDGFRAGPVTVADADHWPATTAVSTGSWWDDHRGWLAARSGALVDAPPELGGRGLHALAPTPGDYVLS
jgi:poly(3-hydroxyalkanoate) synthetase